MILIEMQNYFLLLLISILKILLEFIQSESLNNLSLTKKRVAFCGEYFVSIVGNIVVVQKV